jgi:hypothetical protein
MRWVGHTVARCMTDRVAVVVQQNPVTADPGPCSYVAMAAILKVRATVWPTLACSSFPKGAGSLKQQHLEVWAVAVAELGVQEAHAGPCRPMQDLRRRRTRVHIHAMAVPPHHTHTHIPDPEGPHHGMRTQLQAKTASQMYPGPSMWLLYSPEPPALLAGDVQAGGPRPQTCAFCFHLSPLLTVPTAA